MDSVDRDSPSMPNSADWCCPFCEYAAPIRSSERTGDREGHVDARDHAHTGGFLQVEVQANDLIRRALENAAFQRRPAEPGPEPQHRLPHQGRGDEKREERHDYSAHRRSPFVEV